MTNADKIRNMTNEDLAEFLEKVISGHREEIGIKCGMINVTVGNVQNVFICG